MSQKPENSIGNEPLFPVRGLVPIQNAKGRPFAARDIHRWLRLNRFVYRTPKVDLLVKGRIPSRMTALVGYGQLETVKVPLGLRISVRTDCPEVPHTLSEMKWLGLYDVFLCPPTLDAPYLLEWLDACRKQGIPMRLQVQPPFPSIADMNEWADRIAAAGVYAVNVVLSDPFETSQPCRSAEESRHSVAQMNALASALRNRGIEVNLFGWPLCLVSEEHRECAGGMERFFLDHQQYVKCSYDLALRLYRRHPAVVSLAVTALLGRHTSFRSPSDEALMAWLVTYDHRKLKECLYFVSKLTRRFGLQPWARTGLDPCDAVYADHVIASTMREAGTLTAECRTCSLYKVCDRETKAFKKHLPGLKVSGQKGETVLSPAVFLRRQKKHYDFIDRERRDYDPMAPDLVRQATEIMLNSPPDRTFGFHDVQPEKVFCMRMPGAYRYMSLFDRELLSTLLFWGEAPFTACVTFGGGIADYVGFVAWEHRLVCPMEAFSHQVALHVAADGRYLLLRDGAPVRPVEFEGLPSLPKRLPSAVQLRLSMWNVDGCVSVQNPQIWLGKPDAETERGRIIYSVIVVSTRFSRRLQAVLQSIAHQEGIDLRAVEVIVGYVPGIDPTDDVIASMQLAYPALRILRSPFPEANVNSKGRIINKSFEMVSGKWVIILDSDIILAPDLIARLSRVDESCMLAAPMGRKMLTRETTAKILLGEVHPWKDWAALLEGPGEPRYGKKREGGEVPVGFCQCVRASCLKEIKYNEYEHFEGADWEFAMGVIQRFGPCTWLEAPVLHLDHGGNQWYGTSLQR